MKRFLIASFLALLICPLPSPSSDGLPGNSAPTPKRIITLLPSLTELVFDLGASDRLVGISDYCVLPEGGPPLPRVGGLIPNLERMAELRPDLILADTSQAQGLKRARDIGLRVEITPSTSVRTLGELYALIARVGSLIGRPSEAGQIVQLMQDRLKHLSEKLAGRPAPTVMSVLWWEPLMVAGRRSLQNEIIRSAGGRNVAGDLKRSSATLSDEVVLRWNPDVILVPETADLATARSRTGWIALTAVRNGRLFSVEKNLIGHYGPRLADGIEALAGLLHPEVNFELKPSPPPSPFQGEGVPSPRRGEGQGEESQSPK